MSPDISFEVYCGRCGAGLCNQTSVDTRNGRNCVTVDPCKKCLESERDDGREEGRQEERKGSAS